jgi:hypothetical protein
MGEPPEQKSIINSLKKRHSDREQLPNPDAMDGKLRAHPCALDPVTNLSGTDLH